MTNLREVRLIELLRNSKIIHPTRVDQILISGCDATLRVQGVPWWLPPKNRNETFVATADILLKSISQARITESWLRTDTFKEDLEGFGVSDCKRALWNQGLTGQIFCKPAGLNLRDLLDDLDAFLSETECPFSKSSFLNDAVNFNQCVLQTTSDIYQLCNAPMAVCERMSLAFERQDVKHSITCGEIPFVTGVLVKWWDGFVVCNDALLSYENSPI